ncbi:MAG: formate--tetrahydrofolate ligase [Armatimonadota bacterium]|nr:formate--tetrahydrofolate ligase [Armatimonadota bacterium]
MPSDIQISQQARMKPIIEIAQEAGVLREELEPYGDYMAKVTLGLLDRLEQAPDGKLILVTAVTPTPLGEGKTVTTIGLAQALRHIGEDAIVTLREPSMGPTFGIKGGATGGGHAQVVPMEEINLHFTGDMHAVAAANNLLAAMIDGHLWHGNPLDIDPLTISWSRNVDMSDVALRHMVIGLGGRRGGIPREAEFEITAASEVMAILSLTSGLQDVRERLGRIRVAMTRDGAPVTAEDLHAAGAMAALMRNAVKPNLVQTLEGGPALVHAGPFANIAVGSNSILADRMALKLADYVTTEAGFGADCGAEKFFNIKCRLAGYQPAAAVIVATVRALQLHGGAFEFRPGTRPPEEEFERENVEAVVAGAENLAKQIENIHLFGVPAVVAVNRFPTDTDAEVAAVREAAMQAGAEAAVVSNVWAEGGAGGAALAEAVLEVADTPSDFRFLYPLDAPITEKIEIICTRIYGADGVQYSPKARRRIRDFEEQGLGELPICMAKTQLSLSHDPDLKGRPTGFTVPIEDIRASVGAGFLYPMCGSIRTMPGLPTRPAAADVDIDEDGRIVGLF